MDLHKIFYLLKEMGLPWVIRRSLYEVQRKSGYLEKKLGYRRPRPGFNIIVNKPAADFINEQCGRFFITGLEDYAANRHLFLNRAGEDFVIQAAERARRGIIRCFSKWFGDYGHTPGWFKDPLSGKEMKSNKHWTRINEFSGGMDIKMIWELSRFPQVYYFARACGVTGDHRYAEAFWEQVESWIYHNPYQRGPNWFCGQELSIRVMAWIFGLFAFKDSPYTTQSRVEKLIESLYCHGIRIEQNFTYALKLVKNNHAISEAAGLFTLGVLFPFFRCATRWRDIGIKYLQQEGLRQIYPDGSYLQHSFNYQRMIVQLYSWCLRLAEVNGVTFDNSLLDRLDRCVKFLYQMQDSITGCLPNYGNNDGALIFPLSSSDYLDYRPQLNTLHYIINGSRLYHAGRHDEELFWFCGSRALKARVDQLSRISSAFTDGGYYVLRNNLGFGFTRCTNYKDRPAQADMLHFDLWWNGVNVLCDAGTYLYNCAYKWSNYFSGTTGHNTVNINGYNQMHRTGAFAWYKWTRSKVYGFGELNGYRFFEGEHYGYSSVTHRRAIININDIWFVIDDLFGPATERLRLELHWLLGNFPQDIDEQNHFITLLINNEPYIIKIMPEPRLCTTLIYGRENNCIKGWRSRYYGYKEKVPSICSVINTAPPHRFISAFYPGRSGDVTLSDKKLVYVDANNNKHVIALGNTGGESIINLDAREL